MKKFQECNNRLKSEISSSTDLPKECESLLSTLQYHEEELLTTVAALQLARQNKDIEETESLTKKKLNLHEQIRSTLADFKAEIL